jgi:hypothetical protein
MYAKSGSLAAADLDSGEAKVQPAITVDKSAMVIRRTHRLRVAINPEVLPDETAYPAFAFQAVMPRPP